VADLPELAPLHDPVLIAAFEGWNDAGEAATAAVEHLVRVWSAHEVTELDPEDYYDFQVNRPKVSLEDGRRSISWPATRVFVARGVASGRDAVLIVGIEPSTRWRSFVRELLGICEHLGVTTAVTLGALLADVPHTRPIPVSMTSDSAGARRRFGADVSEYQGPTGIVGVFTDALHHSGVTTISCWAAVPHYAGGPPSPKATLALLGRLEGLMGVAIPAGEVQEAARAWEHKVDEMAEADEEVAEYVAALEDDADTPELEEASGDEIAREFERYLRGQGEDSGGS